MIVLHNMLLSHDECLYALIILSFNGTPQGATGSTARH